jgi:ribosomal protein S20
MLQYMIDTEGFTYDAAFSRIKSMRQAAEPNDGFTSQLRSYEKKYRSQDGVGRASEAATNASAALSILADKANYASV